MMSTGTPMAPVTPFIVHTNATWLNWAIGTYLSDRHYIDATTNTHPHARVTDLNLKHKAIISNARFLHVCC
jgi:hypothetical protein